MRLVINNGLVIDPKNKIFTQLNIAVENGKVKEISKNILKGDYEIDATGLCVTPGFVDIHMHEDPIVDDKIKLNIFDRMLKMGVTTVIGGNCGIGTNNPKRYFELLNEGNPVNCGLLLPHSILREYIGAKNRYESLELDDIEKMYEYGKKLMKENKFFGVSFGIRYIPGMDFNELINIAKLGEGKVVAAHIRDDAENVYGAMEEFLEIGDYVKTHLQVSHIGSMAGFGQIDKVFQIIDEKRAKGLDVSCDCYPYSAFSTKIGETTFDEGFIERYNTGYESLEVMEGEFKGKRCTEEMFFKIRKEHPETMLVGHLMNSEDIEKALINPNTVMASDGILGINGDGHPRAAGSFPRFLAKYVRDKKLMSLYEGIEKITYAPAKLYKINKGGLSIGDDGDITIFSLEELEDKATFAENGLSPKGIKYVIINGEIAVKNNEIINGKLGTALK